VSDAQRTEFMVHHEGAMPTSNTGAAAMRSIDAAHRVNGWSGIGYNHVVMLDGSAWEGRGWNLVGAHCSRHNTSGVGVQIHLGGDQAPTQAALASCRALYDEACRRSGRELAIKGHQDGYATECPGVILEAWVREGMPAPTAPPQPVPHMEAPMLLRAKTPSVDGSVPKGAVMACSLNQRWHIPGTASPLVAAYELAGLTVVLVHGQDIVDAFPVRAGAPVIAQVDTVALVRELVAGLPVGSLTVADVQVAVEAGLRNVLHSA
jgi:hypothetical protein